MLLQEYTKNEPHASSQLELFEAHLPARVHATDELGTLAMMDKLAGIQRAYVTPNAKWEKRWLVFDIDRPGAAVDWQDRQIAAPNITAMNRDNGHAHVFYGLQFPLHADPEKYGKAFRYGAAVEAAYRDALGGDFSYSGFLAKNPLHNRWLVQEWQPVLYDLDWLADYPGVHLRGYTDMRTRLPGYGLGRNCTMFESLRCWSYKARRLDWKDYMQWRAACIQQAFELNAFEAPLSAREVMGIARSVSKWTWSRLSHEGFSAWQARVGRLGGLASGVVRKEKAEARQQLLWGLEGLSVREAAAATGIPRSSVHRLSRKAILGVSHEPISGLVG